MLVSRNQSRSLPMRQSFLWMWWCRRVERDPHWHTQRHQRGRGPYTCIDTHKVYIYIHTEHTHSTQNTYTEHTHTERHTEHTLCDAGSHTQSTQTHIQSTYTHTNTQSTYTNCTHKEHPHKAHLVPRQAHSHNHTQGS